MSLAPPLGQSPQLSVCVGPESPPIPTARDRRKDVAPLTAARGTLARQPQCALNAHVFNQRFSQYHMQRFGREEAAHRTTKIEATSESSPPFRRWRYTKYHRAPASPNPGEELTTQSWCLLLRLATCSGLPARPKTLQPPLASRTPPPPHWKRRSAGTIGRIANNRPPLCTMIVDTVIAHRPPGAQTGSQYTARRSEAGWGSTQTAPWLALG